MNSVRYMIGLKKSSMNNETGEQLFHFDDLTTLQRSRCMARVKSKNTGTELIIRSLLFKMGYRYRLHDKRLPGSPDIVFRSRGKVIFVNGCFWHLHSCLKGKSKPKSNLEFWRNKRQRNKERDKENQNSLLRMGWKYLLVWECELKNLNTLGKKLKAFLG